MLTVISTKTKIFKKNVSAQRCKIEKRQTLMRQIWGHQRIIDEKQGGSKEIGYQLKDDALICIGFLLDKPLKIYIRKETYTYEMVREKDNKVSKRKS